MFNKVYENSIKFIKENYLWLLLYLVVLASMLYPLPYYIYTGGGIINIDSKVNVDDGNNSKGSFNMCYVSEINATIPTYIISYFNKNWDVVSKEDVSLSTNETRKDILIRDQVSLLGANQNAIITAYNYANVPYSLTNRHNYIIYISEESDTDLKVGDELLKVDNIAVTDIRSVANIIDNKNVGDKIELTVKNGDKETTKYAIVRMEENRKVIGISFETIYDYTTDKKIDFNFKNNESGPSGGLMLSLFIYDKLVSEDITKGLKISGTGTIDGAGNVGEIGGVKYKLNGAVKAKSDIFLVPAGDNYEEAIREQKKHNYKIKIIGVSTFEEALKKLKEM